MDRLYRLNPKLRVFGIIPSIVDTRTKVPHVEMDRLRRLYPRLRLLPPINKGVALERAMGLRISILEYMPHSPQAAAYRDVARILIEAASGRSAPSLPGLPRSSPSWHDLGQGAGKACQVGGPR